jgi:hypothetical protein
MKHPACLLLALALGACAADPATPPVPAVCVVSPDDEHAPGCPEEKEAPPKADESCIELESSTTLNHTPPKPVPFCTPGEVIDKVRKPAGKPEGPKGNAG